MYEENDEIKIDFFNNLKNKYMSDVRIRFILCKSKN